jgi:hypothetical protein
MTTEKEVKEYLGTHFKSSWERTDFIRKINIELQEVDHEREEVDWVKRQAKARRKIERQNEVGETMKKVVKAGMVVKCRGTKDGLGIREVMEVNEYGIVARKICQQRRTMGTMSTSQSYIRYYRDGYITEHQWNKVTKILDIEVDK